MRVEVQRRLHVWHTDHAPFLICSSPTAGTQGVRLPYAGAKAQRSVEPHAQPPCMGPQCAGARLNTGLSSPAALSCIRCAWNTGHTDHALMVQLSMRC